MNSEERSAEACKLKDLRTSLTSAFRVYYSLGSRVSEQEFWPHDLDLKFLKGYRALGFRVWGLGVYGFGFRVWGLGFRVLGFGV